MLTKLFADGPASDPGYVNIRDAKDGILKSARGHCEYLWILYQYHADEQFRIELKSNFDPRYWEMYLAMSLIFSGYEVTCPKPGPDVGIMHGGRRVWFEATTPTRGALDNPDQVPKLRQGELQDIPEEKLILRYLTRISDKCEKQYQSWLKQGIVSKDDAFVVALNTHELGFHDQNADPAPILQVAYPLGKPEYIVDKQSLKALEKRYQYRASIPRAELLEDKAEGAEKKKPQPVDSALFNRPEYAGLSGILCSHVDAANRPGEMGSDFELAPNPNATAPLPDGMRLRGKYYERRASDGGDVIVQTDRA